MKQEDDKASIEKREADNYALVSLVGDEDLVQERIQIAEGTHK
jgi:hypothetical protein